MRLTSVILAGLCTMTIVGFAGGVALGNAETPAERGLHKAAKGPGGKSEHAPAVDANKPKFPIPIPPASQLRSLLRQQKAPKDTTPPLQDQPTGSVPQMLQRYGSALDSVSSTCNRAIPTRQEFLNMLRRNPAEANQILRSCSMNLGNLSPLPQLPVGRRQLPEDTRQRPVGTWDR